MIVTQAAQAVNGMTAEVIGAEAIQTEDLSNIVDVGKQVFDVTSVENAWHSLIDQVGKIVVSGRLYTPKLVSVMHESWEYGSVKMIVEMADLPEATENESWELEDGRTYNQDIYTKSDVKARFYNSKVTFEIPVSRPEIQIREAFQSAEQMLATLTLIETQIKTSMNAKLEQLAKRTITNAIADTIADAYGTTNPDYTQAGNTRAINLLKRYNDEFGTSLTAAHALKDAEFLRYAALTIKLNVDRMTELSTLYNLQGYTTFTPKDMLNIVMLSEFRNGIDVYLYGNKGEFKSDEYAKLPAAETIASWQGSGTDYAFSSTSKINVKTKMNNEVEVSGILAVAFDHDAIGIANEFPRTRTHVNDKAEFVNAWHKMDAQYWNLYTKNIVVYFVA